MKRTIPLIFAALPLMAGCVSANSAEGYKAEAYAKCRYAPRTGRTREVHED
jgi:hypothetical protein